MFKRNSAIHNSHTADTGLMQVQDSRTPMELLPEDELRQSPTPASLPPIQASRSARVIPTISSPAPPIIQNKAIIRKDDTDEEDDIDSDAEILAIQALGQLKNSGPTTPILSHGAIFQREENADSDATDNDMNYDTANENEPDIKPFARSRKLLRKMKDYPIVNSAVRVYKSNKPAIKYGVEMVERATLPMVTMLEETRQDWKRKRRLSRANEMFPDDEKITVSSPLPITFNPSKKQKLPSISEALALGDELRMNMSIESKKRLTTCLQLLMLANKQLSSKVTDLQDLINKEKELIERKRKLKEEQTEGEREVFHDAQEDITSASTKVIKQEIVGTVKKVVTLISKYAGNSLPEPERSNVRETLLRLPNKWASQASNSLLTYNTNGKVLVLANESLDMVSSVMSVFDETLTKAEIWIRQKHEKQLTKQAILNSSLKRQQVQDALNQETSRDPSNS